MNAGQLLTHFDRLAEAPDAVPRLRRFILDLAVRGKLVGQDAGDEPAIELFKQIQAEKLKNGNGRTSKSELGDPTKEGEPFAIPEHWVWTSLGDVADLVRGITFSASDKSTIHVDGTLPCFRSGNIQNEIVWDDFVFVPKTVLKSDTQLVRANDILISIANSYELVGKSSIVTTVNQEATFGAFLAAIRLFVLPPQFFQHVLASGYSATAFRVGSSQTTNIANITFGTIRAHQIPLPPLAEQHRIVAKVDELMALCDQLEAAQQERERRRDRLAAASLQRLNQPTEANPATDQTEPAEARQQAQREQQKDHARFHLQNLHRLTTRPEHIKAMRRTILSLATCGRLVHQDTKDGNAAELVKAIEFENQSLRNAKGISGQKAGVLTEGTETSADIPGTWLRASLQDLSYQITDGTHLTPKYTDQGKLFLSAQNVKPFRFIPFKHRFVSVADFKNYRANRKPERGDVLLTRVGAGIGEAAVLDSDLEFAFYVSLCLIKIPTRLLLPTYLVLWLNSPEGRDCSTARTYGKGASQGNLNLGQIRTFKVPLPPLAEQHRIVAKVDELMALSDQLEAQLTQSQTDSRRLLEAVLEAAIA